MEGLIGLLFFVGVPILYCMFIEKPPKEEKFWPSYHQDIELGMSKEDIIKRYAKKKRKKIKKNKRWKKYFYGFIENLNDPIFKTN